LALAAWYLGCLTGGRLLFWAAFRLGAGVVDTFAWWYDADDQTDDLEDLVAEIGEAIVRAPSPRGNDDFVVKVLAFGPRAEDAHGVLDTVEGRALLCAYTLPSRWRAGAETCLLDRWHDWKRGDARERLAQLLREHRPTPAAPLVAVRIWSPGQLVLDIAEARGIDPATGRRPMVAMGPPSWPPP